METMRGFVAGLLLGAALGGAAAWAALPRPSLQAAPVAVSVSVPVPGAPPAPLPAPVTAPAPAPAPAVEIEAMARTLTAAFATAPPPRYSMDRTVRIRGDVRDAEGRPIAGVVVCAEPSEPHFHVSGDLEQRFRAVLAQYHHEASLRREAVTGPDGRYEIPDAHPESDMKASREWFSFDREGDAPGALEGPEATVDFRGRGVGRVVVDVVQPDGSAPTSARMYLDGDEMIWSWKADNRSFEHDPGTYRLRAIAGESEELASAEETIVLVGGETAHVRLSLVPRAVLIVRVETPAGEEKPSFAIWVGRAEAARALDIGDLYRDCRGGRPGENVFPDLPPGRYTVVLTRLVVDPVARAEVDVGTGVAAVELALPAPDSRGSIAVEVLGPDGGRVKEYRAIVDFDPPEGWAAPPGLYQDEIRLSDGRRVFIVDPSIMRWWRAEGGRVRASILVESKYGSKKVEVAPAAEAAVIVRFGEPARLEVAVAGSEALADRPLTLTIEGQDGAHSTGPVEGGRAIFTALAPGAAMVELRSEHGRGGSAPIARAVIALRPGNNAATIPVPQLHHLTVLSGRPGLVTLARSSSPAESQYATSSVVDAAGMASFDLVPPGTYEVNLEPGGDAGMIVTLPGPSEVRLELAPPDAFLVRVSDPSGYLAGAGFEAGDLVIGVGGREFARAPAIELYAAAGAAGAGETAEFLVLRRGATLAVAADPVRLAQERDLGGGLSPARRPR